MSTVINFIKPKQPLSRALQIALKAIQAMQPLSDKLVVHYAANNSVSGKTRALPCIRILLLCLVLYGMTLPAQAQVTNYAGTETNPAERISNVICYQGGQKITEESDLHNLMFGNNMIYGDRADGKRITILGVQGDAATVCKLVERRKIKTP